MGRDEKIHIGPMVAIGLLAAVIGIAIGLVIDWFPTAASTQAKDIDTLWDVLIIASVPVFVGVMTIVLYSVWRFRMRPGEEELDGPPIHGNTRLEIVWTAIPAMLLVALCTYSYIVLTDIEDAKADELSVRVVGEQFTWTFHYKGSDGKEFVSNQLYVPVGKPVHFTVQSKDVIHDFWVPAFRMKIDAVRGINTDLRVTPNKTGTYPVVCAELCGIGHAAMRQTAHVVSRQDFDKWVSDRQAAAQGGGGEPAAGGGGGGAAPDGKALFTSNGCGGCHALADAGTSGGVGPDLDQVLKGKDDAFIKQSIVDPNAEIASGYQPNVMPQSFGQTLGPEEQAALVKYLAEVTK